MLDLNLLEQNPFFVLDSNSLNRMPRKLLEVFDFYCPQGVVREVERWTSLLEVLPQHIVQLEEEIAQLGEILKVRGWLEESRGVERYPEMSELVERIFLEEKLKGKLRSHFSQLLEKVQKERPEKDAETFILALADGFQSEESLRVDVEVLRASFKLSDEFSWRMVFVVTEDPGLIDLFILSRSPIKAVSQRQVL